MLFGASTSVVGLSADLRVALKSNGLKQKAELFLPDGFRWNVQSLSVIKLEIFQRKRPFICCISNVAASPANASGPQLQGLLHADIGLI